MLCSGIETKIPRVQGAQTMNLISTCTIVLFLLITVTHEDNKWEDHTNVSLYAWWIAVRPKCQLVINPSFIRFVVFCLGEKYCSAPTIVYASLQCSLCGFYRGTWNGDGGQRCMGFRSQSVFLTIPALLLSNCVISYGFLNFSLSSSVNLEKISIHNGF